jgi:predicted Zn finger-like uncharacterized protein
MALAAVCPSCNTRFRVVADQLKLRNGWVRCGSCAFAFNAVERLSYVPDDTIIMRRSVLDELAAQIKPAQPTSAAPAALPAKPAASKGSDDLAWPSLDESAQHVPAARVRAPSAAPAPVAPAPIPAAPARTAPAPIAEPAAAAAATAPIAASPPPANKKPRASRGQRVQDDDAYELHTIIELSATSELRIEQNAAYRTSEELAAQFLQRDAQSAERARRITRWSAIGAGVATLALLGQLAYAFRNELAATAPATRPVLELLCAGTGCSVDLPAHAATLSLESLQLAQVGGGDVYQATVLIKNLSTMPQRAPHLELTLTRVNGDLAARRVLTPQEWLPAQVVANGLPPQGETVAQFSLQIDKTSTAAFSGFGGVLFYPAP